MNKQLSTLIEISEIIRGILKNKFKMKLIIDFSGNGTFSFRSELGMDATEKLLKADNENIQN